MFKPKKILVIAVATMVLTPLSESLVEARAGTACKKVGQVRKFGGVSYTCTAGKGKKARKTWVANGTSTPTVTSATWNCGSPFTNDRYPQFRLNDLLMKPATQSVATYLSTPSCVVDVNWTLSPNAKINASRSIFICYDFQSNWPDSYSILDRECNFDFPFEMTTERALWSIPRESEPGVPYYGFLVAHVRGYLGDATSPAWESPPHLIMFDVDRTLLPDTWGRQYSALNKLMLP